MAELEQYILSKIYDLDLLLKNSIKELDFNKFYTELHNFCANELSAFYFDIRKDTVYCDRPDNPKRIACLYVMRQIFMCLVHWLAPVLSFTAEEAWKAYNPESESIHLNQFPNIPSEWSNAALENKWENIQSLRKTITEAIEIERAAKTVGSSLECEISVYINDLETLKMLEKADIAELSIVSKAKIINAQSPSNAAVNEELGIGIVVKKTSGVKCDRCWKISTEIAKHDTEYGTANLCDRCHTAI